VVVALAVPVVAIAYVFSVDWVSAVILIVTLPLIPLFTALIGRVAEDSTRKRWQTFQLLGGHFLDVLQGLPTLRLFGRGRAQVARLGEISDRLRATTMATLRIAFLSSFTLELLASLGVALLAVTIAVRLVDGTLDLRSGLTVLILAPEVYLPMRNLGAAFHGSMEGVDAAGASFAGANLYVLLGHGRDYAWSATTATSDDETATHAQTSAANIRGPAATTTRSRVSQVPEIPCASRYSCRPASTLSATHSRAKFPQGGEVADAEVVAEGGVDLLGPVDCCRGPCAAAAPRGSCPPARPGRRRAPRHRAPSRAASRR